MKDNPVKSAAKAMAALYTWETVVSILEGPADPGRMGRRESRDVQRVIKIAKAAQLRMLNKYDRDVARAEKKANPV